MILSYLKNEFSTLKLMNNGELKLKHSVANTSFGSIPNWSSIVIYFSFTTELIYSTDITPTPDFSGDKSPQRDTLKAENSNYLQIFQCTEPLKRFLCHCFQLIAA